MEKRYTVEKRTGVVSGAGWKSSSEMCAKWAIVIEPFGIEVKTFDTETEAIEYLNKHYNKEN